MTALGLLRFEPTFRRYVWGGRRLGTVLGKPIGAGDGYAESWEVVDHGDDQSVVRAGPYRGHTLHALIERSGRELLGRHGPRAAFPLLFKYLDARQNLSVQVHPDDALAARLDPPDLGKTEAWVVVDALPGSLIYAGLKRGFDRELLAREVARGTTVQCLHTIQPRPGDCIFIPARVVHAIGTGLLVAEIQQASDTTFRLFDWNRVGRDGKPRQLHVEQALDTIDYDRGPVHPQVPQPTGRQGVERLVACDKFVLDRLSLAQSATAGGDGRFHVMSVLQGAVRFAGDPTGEPLGTGETVLLPAAAGAVRVEPEGRAVLLDMYLP